MTNIYQLFKALAIITTLKNFVLSVIYLPIFYYLVISINVPLPIFYFNYKYPNPLLPKVTSIWLFYKLILLIETWKGRLNVYALTIDNN